jgi:ketosteroid isomerase-like protein
MPEKHLELIRQGHEDFSRGDLSTTKEWVAEDVEWFPTGIFPGVEGVYRGPNALDRWMETIRAEWQEFEVSLVEVLAEVDDAVAVVERLWGRGRESGAEAEMTIYSVYKFNADDKVVQRLAFTTREKALAAL